MKRPGIGRIFAAALAGGCILNASAAERALAPPVLATTWSAPASLKKTQPQYPRPTMVRSNWLSLNGSWDFGITHRDITNAGAFTGKILVPFPVESALSGVTRPVTEQQRIWYRRKFSVPAGWQGRRIMLHFEAVDWESRVWVNEKELGTHKGGYDRFSFDITDTLKPGNVEQELMLSVYDPTNGGTQPRGAQALAGSSGSRSACSGIWQTVWLEPVSATSIQGLKLASDIDSGTVEVTVLGRGETNGVTLQVVAAFGGQQAGRTQGAMGQPLRLSLANPRLWSPEAPALYDLKVTLSQAGRKLDEVSSYFGMRKIGLEKDAQGVPRLMLNHQPLFQFGPLDLGYWPEGGYTAPTDDALRSDIEAMKLMGFNLCRKHQKVEPERWYYWCDRLGILVWQDMPGGITRRPQPLRQYEAELERLLEGRRNHPSIVMWVPFATGSQPEDAARILARVKQLDPSRLVLSTGPLSGPPLGDVQAFDVSNYKKAAVAAGHRARVVGSYGGIQVPVAGHTWSTNLPGVRGALQAFPPPFLNEYTNTVRLVRFLGGTNGFSGAVFKQLTDVEMELDGLLTYDRLFKFHVNVIAGANHHVWQPEPKR